MLIPEIGGLGIYHSQVAAKSNTTSKRRTVSKFEIELPIGSGGISYIDSDNKKIAPDFIICAKPGQSRCTRFPYKCFYLYLETSDSPIQETLLHLPDFITIHDYEYYHNLFTRMLQYKLRTDRSESIILYSLMLKLIHSLKHDSETMLSQNSNRTNQKAMQALLDYIPKHLSENLSLSALADICGYSAVHLHNSFKKFTGKTPQSYIEELRIQKAIDFMLTTDKSFTEIAYECGFSSQSYFSYVFKRRTKLSPGEYVKKIVNHYEI